MTNTGRPQILSTLLLALFLFALFLSACSPSSTPTEVQMSEPPAVPIATPVPTLATLPDGTQVYGDPEGRFTFPFPLGGEWTLVESDSSYAQFAFADPVVDMYVSTNESDELKAGVEAVLAEIGVVRSELSLLDTMFYPPWLIFIYSFEDDQGIGVAARVLDDMTIAIIPTAEMIVLSSLYLPFLATIDGFSTMPLADYLEFSGSPIPSTVEDIGDLDTVEFYSGRTKLVGRLTLPEGDGPFPAIVYTGSGSGQTTRSQFYSGYLRDAGLAVFSYDKRGAGDSEGAFIEVGLETDEWRLGQLGDDALAAVTFLQGLEEINPDQIGLMGVSQNGWTIPLAASQSDAVAFTVIVAGPTVSLGEESYWSELTGGGDTVSESKREETSEQLAAYDGSRGFDPRPSLEAMSMPGLWILGGLDGSIPTLESIAILENIIEEYDKDFSILYYPGSGHSVSPARPEVVEWILAKLKE